MKSTGVIRRIDELGRIVIPKEIRKNLRINNNVSLELFIEDDKLILKKYSILKSIKDIAQSLSDVLYSSLNHNIIITDLFNVLAVSGSNKKYLNKDISNSIEDSIRRREKIFENYEKELEIIKDEKINCSYIINTIISNSEEIGTIIVYDDVLTEQDYKVINVVSNFIGKYLEQ